nr:speckle-type POZ protein-like [Aedes albopictus]XP_029729186.1 speckle-type POZ protein-like [Aedes albopictus]
MEGTHGIGSINVIPGAVYNVIWTVPINPSHNQSLRRGRIESEQFGMLGNTWKLCLAVVVYDSYNIKTQINAFLEMVDYNDTVELSYFIYTLGTANSKVHCWASRAHKYSPDRRQVQIGNNVDRAEFLEKNIFPEGILTLCCQIIPWETNYSALPNSQLKMLTDEKFTDVTIIVGEQQIKAHKAMLAIHSPVFDAMLSAGMQESRQNVIKIDDFDYEVVQEMLTYIYSDTAPNMHKLADRLLIAADKYELERLKALCERTLCIKVSVDTAVKYQALAKICNAVQLQRTVAEFIANNIAAVQKTDDWKHMVEVHSVSWLCQQTKQSDDHNDD